MESENKSNGKILHFPGTRQFLRRTQNQKAILALSIMSVMMISAMINQWLVTPEQTAMMQNAAARGIASIQQVDPAADIKWQHDLANRLSIQQGQVASLGQKPSLRDEFVFGFLLGKYGMQMQEGKIVGAEFINAQAGDAPLKIENRIQFLNKWKNVFAVNFQEVSLASSSSTAETYKLVSGNKTIVGEVRFEFDEAGRTIKFSLIK